MSERRLRENPRDWRVNMVSICHVSTRTDIVIHNANERIYLRLWQDNNRPGYATTRLQRILSRKPNQRDAIVCASFVQWLGSKNGLILLERAKALTNTSLCKKGVDRRKARAAAFREAFKEASRVVEFQGYTLLAAIMHPVSLLNPFSKPNTVSKTDLQVVMSLLTWLSTPPGTRFIKEAEGQIAVERQKEIARYNRKVRIPA